MAEARQRTAIVFGARNLGRAVLELLLADGWAVTAVARSQGTLDGAAAAGALAIAGDITDAVSVRSCLAEATAAHGPLDLAVNAASAYGGARSGPFGGGPISEAGADAFDSWAAAPGRSAFTFLSAAGAWFREHERAGTLIQVTGGSARRAMPGRGLWAAGSFAVRAITNAAALELREQGIHVALLIVDAGIEPIAGGGRQGVDPAALADPRELARAVRFLAEQNARGTTHELQITPLAERWVP